MFHRASQLCRFSFAACAAAVLFLLPALDASMVRAVGFDELSRSSSIVVAGRVLAADALVDPETGHITTQLRLALQDSIGLPAHLKEWTLKLPGGSAAGREQHVVGLPRVKVGDYVAFFLGADSSPGGVMLPVGLWQGMFFADRDDATGRFRVRDSAGKSVVAVRKGTLITGANEQSHRTWRTSSRALTLTEFMSAVRASRAGVR